MWKRRKGCDGMHIAYTSARRRIHEDEDLVVLMHDPHDSLSKAAQATGNFCPGSKCNVVVDTGSLGFRSQPPPCGSCVNVLAYAEKCFGKEASSSKAVINHQNEHHLTFRFIEVVKYAHLPFAPNPQTHTLPKVHRCIRTRDDSAYIPAIPFGWRKYSGFLVIQISGVPSLLWRAPV
jgi:hypothetical protein